MRKAIGAALLLALWTTPASAQTVEANYDRLVVGDSSLSQTPAVGTLRLLNIGTSGGTLVLLVDANGDVIKRILAKADLPAAIAYEDEGNVFTGASSQIFRNTVAGAASTNDEIRIGVRSGTPRVIWEDSGSGQFEVDNSAGVLRFIATNSSGTATGIPMALGTDVTFDPSSNNVLPATGYDLNLGILTKKYLTVHAAELWVETLVAQDTIATIGGRILVGPTTTLTSDLLAAATSIVVKHNQWASGDRVYLEANGSVEFMAVTSGPSGAGPYTYSVTRNLDGSGANNWTAGDAVFNTGTTGDGWWDVYSIRGVKSSSELGPSIVLNRRNSSTYNDWTPYTALGNLNGLYGYATDIYGAAFGNPSTQNLTIEPTNGVRIRYGTTNRMTLNATDLQFNGDDGIRNLLMTSSGTLELGRAVAGDMVLNLSGGSMKFCIYGTACYVSFTPSGIQAQFAATDTLATPYAYSWVGGTTGGDAYLQAYEASGLLKAAVLRSSVSSANNAAVILWAQTGASAALAKITVQTTGTTSGATEQVQFNVNAHTIAYYAAGGVPTFGPTGAFAPGAVSLGSSTLKWNDIYFSEPATGAALFPLVSSSGRIMAKNDGLNGTTTCAGATRVSSVVVEFGIVISITCS